MVPAPHFSEDTPELTHNQDSSTGHSSDQSNKDDDISTQLIHSQDQCISSSSVNTISLRRHHITLERIAKLIPCKSQ
ncbi:NF-Y protein [Artemisia annua]|uniref:NF-Y protein n=1 Tax=Artemisia annua TaxID=35608 RepID=A0A2U1LVS3_ARTAN|nr:NF-Y protein [Artemisia annua]